LSYDDTESTDKMDGLKGLNTEDGFITPEEILSIVDNPEDVLEDIEKARLNILKSDITLSSIGPVQKLENLDAIRKRFN